MHFPPLRKRLITSNEVKLSQHASCYVVLVLGAVSLPPTCPLTHGPSLSFLLCSPSRPPCLPLVNFDNCLPLLTSEPSLAPTLAISTHPFSLLACPQQTLLTCSLSFHLRSPSLPPYSSLVNPLSLPLFTSSLALSSSLLTLDSLCRPSNSLSVSLPLLPSSLTLSPSRLVLGKISLPTPSLSISAHPLFLPTPSLYVSAHPLFLPAPSLSVSSHPIFLPARPLQTLSLSLSLSFHLRSPFLPPYLSPSPFINRRTPFLPLCLIAPALASARAPYSDVSHPLSPSLLTLCSHRRSLSLSLPTRPWQTLPPCSLSFCLCSPSLPPCSSPANSLFLPLFPTPLPLFLPTRPHLHLSTIEPSLSLPLFLSPLPLSPSLLTLSSICRPLNPLSLPAHPL